MAFAVALALPSLKTTVRRQMRCMMCITATVMKRKYLREKWYEVAEGDSHISVEASAQERTTLAHDPRHVPRPDRKLALRDKYRIVACGLQNALFSA
jgi:hypothetical protein